MNYDYYMKRKHLFKKRTNNLQKKNYPLKFGESSLCSAKKQRFDFVFIRNIKKLFRRRYCKVKMRFFRPKFWLTLHVNCICSSKSKNARMGAGVGLLVRLVMQLERGYNLLEFKYYPLYFLEKAKNYFEFKWNLSFFYKYSYIN